MWTFLLCTAFFSGGFLFGLFSVGRSSEPPLQRSWDHYAPYKEEPLSGCTCPDCRSKRLEVVE